MSQRRLFERFARVLEPAGPAAAAAGAVGAAVLGTAGEMGAEPFSGARFPFVATAVTTGDACGCFCAVAC